MKKQSQIIKRYEAQIKTLKGKNHTLQQQINQRVRNYLIQHQYQNTLQIASYSSHKQLKRGYLSSEYREKIQEKNVLIRDISDKKEIKNLQKMTKIVSLSERKKPNLNLLKAIDLKIYENDSQQIIGKDPQSQYIPTQQDSINLDDEAKPRSIILKQKDLQITQLNNKIEQLNLKLEESQSRNQIFQEELKIHHQKNSNKELHSMKSLIDQLQSSLKIQQEKSSSGKQIKQTLEKQNSILKNQINLLLQTLSQNNKLNEDNEKNNNKLKQKLNKENLLRQQFLKSYDRLKEQKQKLQVQLLEQKKLQTYQNYQPIQQSQIQQRLLSQKQSKKDKLIIKLDQKDKQMFQKILKTFQNLLPFLFRNQVSQIYGIFQNLKDLYENCFKRVYYCTIDIKQSKENMQNQIKYQNNKIHLEYKQIINQLINKYEEKIHKYQQNFDKIINKFIKHHTEQIIKIALKQQKASTKKSQIKNRQRNISQIVNWQPKSNQKEESQIQKQRRSSFFILQNLQQNFDNQYQDISSLTFNKQLQIAKIKQLETKIEQINRNHNEQKSSLYKRLYKSQRQFSSFMNKIIYEKNFKNDKQKYFQQKVTQINNINSKNQDSFINEIKQKLYIIVQLIPLQQQQATLFYPQTYQQIIQMLNTILNFFNKYQKIQATRLRQVQRVQESIFSLITKFIKQYDIMQDQILSQLKDNSDISNLKNWIHQYYKKKSFENINKSDSFSSNSLRIESTVTFGKRTNSQFQQFDQK